jgi:phenylalanyl-tRNA synthetase alpha chain
MRDKLQKIKQQILDELKRTQTLEQLDDLHKKYFSRKSGELNRLIKDIRQVEKELKPIMGKFVNEIKEEVERAFNEVKDKLTIKSRVTSQKSKVFDLTLPGTSKDIGNLHPLTQVQEEIEDVFKSLGFMILDGPELESDWYNFEALNIPADHPAREMQDTFYINNQEIRDKKQINSKFHPESSSGPNPKLVMRTHTSNVQVRAMEKYGVPLRCIVPGRVFRHEATDSRHEHTFYQVEGLMIDENIFLSHLKAVIDAFIKAILGQQFKMRLRPGFFAFVEPGLEVDLYCVLCQGKGCRVCKYTGWTEFMGAGLVHPHVLRAGGVDPQKYAGFAFGFGLERIAMMKYGIDDIRLFHCGDLRFLRQF